MKRYIGLFMVIIFCFCFQPYAHSVENCKVAVVDIQKFQEKSMAFQKVKEDYIKKLEPMGNELEKQQAELVKLEEELRKQSLMLSLDAKEDKRKELGKKSRRYKYLEEDFVQERKEMEMETIRSISSDIQKIVEEIGKREGYSMILEKRAVGFLYNDDKIDITDEVIKAYDNMKK